MTEIQITAESHAAWVAERNRQAAEQRQRHADRKTAKRVRDELLREHLKKLEAAPLYGRGWDTTTRPIVIAALEALARGEETPDPLRWCVGWLKLQLKAGLLVAAEGP